MADKIALPTIWHIPDDLWTLMEQLLPPAKPSGSVGRPRLCPRRVLDGILYVLRTGCQWKALPREYGSGSSIHRYFQRWVELHLFEQLWAILLEYYDDRVGIAWGWQAADGTMLKAPLGGSLCGRNPTDRGKSGTKRHVLVDQRGAPLSVVLAGANRQDMRLLRDTLDSIVTERPSPLEYKQHLCLDKGYDYPACDTTVADYGYIGHIRRKGEPPVPRETRTHPARRWIVECVHSWHNRFRKVKIRYEKKDWNYLGLVDFASALIVYRIIYRYSPRAKTNWVLG
jgi:putative transposase